MKWFKRALWSVLLLIVALAATPFLLVEFAPPSIATSARILLNAIVGYGVASPASASALGQLRVPEGFHLSVYASDLPKLRVLRFSPQGDLLLSRPRAGEVWLLERDRNGDGLPDGRRQLIGGLTRPHGIELNDGWLYIAESDAVGRVRFDAQRGVLDGDYQRLITGLGADGNHWTKTLRAGPDGWFYLSSGSTCNVCEESDTQRATLMRFRPDGSDLQIYASGLRNSVGFDFAPWDGALYATDNGRDLLGDDYPPCELNKVVEGGFYGWPYINGFNELDPDLGKGREALLDTAIAPVHGFRAHNAPLGIRFVDGQGLPAQWQRAALVALHGSWNRSERDGYKVVSLHWREDGAIEERDFLQGFLQADSTVSGRPADVVQGPGGAFYVSDDYAGMIYRIVYGATPAPVSTAVSDTASQAVPVENSGEAAPSAQALQQGEALFISLPCRSCHGENGAGGIPLKALASKYSEAELIGFLDTPTPPMPRYPLTEEQRQQLAAYLRERFQ